MTKLTFEVWAAHAMRGGERVLGYQFLFPGGPGRAPDARFAGMITRFADDGAGGSLWGSLWDFRPEPWATGPDVHEDIMDAFEMFWERSEGLLLGQD